MIHGHSLSTLLLYSYSFIQIYKYALYSKLNLGATIKSAPSSANELFSYISRPTYDTVGLEHRQNELMFSYKSPPKYTSYWNPNTGITTIRNPNCLYQQFWPVYEKSLHTCEVNEIKLSVVPEQDFVLGILPSFVLSASRAVVFFMKRKQTPLKQKRDKVRRVIKGPSLITHVLNFCSSCVFSDSPQDKYLATCTNIPSEAGECLHIFQKDAVSYVPFILYSFATITSISNCSPSCMSDLCP